ncbi:MAG: STAS domain-containing protein [Deltaproteobacteria bacterium]|nr:STAS domain-containing protein [Deltaproteobacteria bacterium]
MIEIKQQGDQTVLTPDFDILASTAHELRDEVSRFLKEGRTAFVLDLTNVNSIDSIGIGSIVSCLKTITSNKGTFRVVCPKPELVQLFKVLKLDQTLNIASN